MTLSQDIDIAKEQLVAELRELRDENAKLKALNSTAVLLKAEGSEGHFRQPEDMGIMGGKLQMLQGYQVEVELQQITAALSHAIEGISRLDAQGRYQIVNQAYARMVGYQPEEMIGMLWYPTVHPEDLDRLIAAYQEMLSSGKVEVAARGVRRDGSIFFKQLTMVAIYDAQQQLAGHYCFMKDVSERAQLEAAREAAVEELRQSEQKFRAIFDSMFQFIGLLTPEGIVVEINQTALDVIAADRADVIGQPFWLTPWWTDSPVAQQAQLREGIKRAAAGEIIRFESEHLWAKDQKVFVDFSLKPFLDESGKVIMLIPEGRDITELKLAEAELKSQQQDLTRSNSELQQFAYVASHDLQEPLRMITSYLELLKRRYVGQLDPKADQFIDFAVDGALRLQTLINDLLTYSRVGTTGKPLEKVDCDEVVQNSLRNLQVAITESQAIITHDPLPIVSGDPVQLTQLFQNLMSNAIKFRQQEIPQLHIGCELQNDQWLFSVRDNGIGIEPQYMERIFLIFQRLHSRAEYAGTGIGLAVCKRIIERHGGQLWVESTFGQGSTFYFTFPQQMDNAS
jgi:PAS domain S-box-containing protein